MSESCGNKPYGPVILLSMCWSQNTQACAEAVWLTLLKTLPARLQSEKLPCDLEKKGAEVLILCTRICLHPWIRVGTFMCGKLSICVNLCRTDMPSPDTDPWWSLFSCQVFILSSKRASPPSRQGVSFPHSKICLQRDFPQQLQKYVLWRILFPTFCKSQPMWHSNFFLISHPSFIGESNTACFFSFRLLQRLAFSILVAFHYSWSLPMDIRYSGV